jgi:DNA-binding CsgD family transcriptional regulator
MASTLTDWQSPALAEDSPVFAPGTPVPEEEAVAIWRELALGRWEVLAAVDANGRRHLAIVPAAPKPSVDWRALGARERYVLALVARGCAQKVIAMKLGMAASTVSAAFQSARIALGFRSPNELVRAWISTQPAPTFAESEAALFPSRPRACARAPAPSERQGCAR